MKSYSAYISCPVSVGIGQLKEVIARTSKEVEEVHYWKRHSPYYEAKRALNKANAFVLVLPKNGFKAVISDLPIGCYRELKEAHSLEKEIFIAYKVQSLGAYRIYDAAVSFIADTIEGVPGTSTSLTEACIEYTDNETPRGIEIASESWDAKSLWDKKEDIGFTYDNRLLLSLV